MRAPTYLFVTLLPNMANDAFSFSTLNFSLLTSLRRSRQSLPKPAGRITDLGRRDRPGD